MKQTVYGYREGRRIFSYRATVAVLLLTLVTVAMLYRVQSRELAQARAEAKLSRAHLVFLLNDLHQADERATRYALAQAEASERAATMERLALRLRVAAELERR